MTRKEAIFVLSGLIDNPLFHEKYKTAFDIAIHDMKACHINDELEFDPRPCCISEYVCEHDKIAAIKKIRDEMAEYGSLCAMYAITDTSEKGIEKLIQDVINQLKKQVLNIIDRHIEEHEGREDGPKWTDTK